jgi:5-(carboxyamino)imidazole ribonucleotide synthase
MAKASTGGYDGKGTAVLRGAEDLEALLARVTASDWILEEFVPFEQELSQLACRDRAGNVQCYPLVQTHQHQQICDWVLAPAAVPHAVQAYARNIAASLLTAMNYVGVLSIELFYGPGGLQVNEIAPRTHNSGHYTIEAAHTSQFEQQVRIVAGLPMGAVDLQVPGALMVNLLGFESSEADYLPQRDALAALPAATVHWYGKQGSRPGRKLGHITLLLQGTTPRERGLQAEQLLEQVRQIWPLPPALPTPVTPVLVKGV